MVYSSNLAELVGRPHSGNSIEISGVNSIDVATCKELAFWESDTTSEIKSSDAGCVICLPSVSQSVAKTSIPSPEPRIDFLKIVNELYRTPPEETYIHPSSVVEDGAEIGQRCWIGPNTYIGSKVTVGDRVKIQAGTSIGGEGFAFASDNEGKLWGQIHTGTVHIGDDVEIGSNCSIDRAIFKETKIGEGTKLDNQIHIAHQANIGKNVWIAYQTGISGSVSIGDQTMIHPNAAVAMHVDVGEDVTIAMNSAVLEDVEDDATVAGVPAEVL
ncbi:DapH/DapD/GlmU-related protein [Halosegnis rubeus]|nr:DapH/DapD/GlmU-related protein [Halosegnis rubeus]